MSKQAAAAPHRVLDVTAANGVPFRVVFTPADADPPVGKRYGTGPLATFYDARYPHTEHGQFTGGQYHVSSLLDADRGPIGSRGRGLSLDMGVDAWTIDEDTCAYIAAWLANDGREPQTTPAQALDDFLDTFARSLDGVAEHLSCSEVDTLARLYRAHGRDDTADAWIAWHAEEDTDDDDPDHLAIREQHASGILSFDGRTVTYTP